MVNFIQSDLLDIIVITSKVISLSDLQVVENYVKNIKNIDISMVNISHLSQSKSYLKIIEIPYYSYDNPQKHLLSSDIEEITKQNQIFDNIVLISKL